MGPGPSEQTFPHPKACLYEIQVQLAQWFQRCLKMSKDGHWYTISSSTILLLRQATKLSL